MEKLLPDSEVIVGFLAIWQSKDLVRFLQGCFFINVACEQVEVKKDENVAWIETNRKGPVCMNKLDLGAEMEYDYVFSIV